MSTYLLVGKLAQDWIQMRIPISYHASASRCVKFQLFLDVTIVAAIAERNYASNRIVGKLLVLT